MGTMDIVGIVGRAADALGRLDIMGFDEFRWGNMCAHRNI